MKPGSGMRTRMRRLTAGAVIAVAALGGSMLLAVPPASAATYVPISGAGSTWSANAITAWDANVAQYGVQDGNNYDPPPTRGYAYMPDTAGGTTFMYNLKIGNTRITNLRLSGAAIAGIFTGVITKWNDPIIAR